MSDKKVVKGLSKHYFRWYVGGQKTLENVYIA